MLRSAAVPGIDKTQHLVTTQENGRSFASHMRYLNNIYNILLSIWSISSMFTLNFAGFAIVFTSVYCTCADQLIVRQHHIVTHFMVRPSQRQTQWWRTDGTSLNRWIPCNTTVTQQQFYNDVYVHTNSISPSWLVNKGTELGIKYALDFNTTEVLLLE